MLPFMQSLIERIPRWLKWCSAVTMGMLGLGIGQHVAPSSDIATWSFGALGVFVGYHALPALVLMVDVTMQLAIGLVKLAIVFAVIAGIVYALWLLAS